MRVQRIEHQTKLERKLIAYAQKCSWMAGPHLAELLIDNRLEEWEVAFALLDDRENVVGFCTFLKTDYDPENRNSPWISTIFVDEQVRGRHLSGLLIEAATAYARTCGFTRVYSDLTGFYEKYGFEPIDYLVNYSGDTDQIFAKDIYTKACMPWHAGL